MTRHDELTVTVAEIDAQTTRMGASVAAIGVLVQNLNDQIENTASDGLNGPQTAAVQAQLDNIKARIVQHVDVLDATGTTPTTPFPELPAPIPEAPALPGPFRK